MGRRLSPGFFAALLAALVTVLICSSAWAGFELPPKPEGPVADTADVLTPAQEKILHDKLVKFKKDTNIAFVVATIPSRGGTPIKDATYELAQTWGVGVKDTKAGLLFVIYVDEANAAGPGAKGCGCIRLEVGSYLEGDLTDVRSGEINKKVGPIVVTGDFNKAANVAVDGVIAVLGNSDFSTGAAGATKGPSGEEDAGTTLIVLLIMGTVIGLVCVVVATSTRRRKVTYENVRPPSSSSGYTPPYRPSSSYTPSSSSRRSSSSTRSSYSDDDDDAFGLGLGVASSLLSDNDDSSSSFFSSDDDDSGGFFSDDSDFGGGGDDW